MLHIPCVSEVETPFLGAIFTTLLLHIPCVSEVETPLFFELPGYEPVKGFRE